MSIEEKKDPTEVPAEILARFAELKRTYAERPKKANVLNYGRPGTGKTYALRTLPPGALPLHIDSFDPGGSRSIDELIRKYPEKFFVDARWEVEDDFRPTAWNNWLADFDKREKEGYFKYIGTYVIDSATFWVEAALNAVKGNKSGPATLPEYNMRQIKVRHELKRILNLPCNVIINAHPDYDKDEGTGKIIAGPIGGKMALRFPPMFDEIYYSYTKESSQGIDYLWAIRPFELYFARSRMTKGGDTKTITIKQDYTEALKLLGL